MNLYKIWHDERVGYDEFDSAIVAAHSETEARLIHPQMAWGDEFTNETNIAFWKDEQEGYGSWIKDPLLVNVEKIGTASDNIKVGVVLASFNAG